MAPVISITTRDLVSRRDEILSEPNLSSYDEFRSLAAAHRLSDRGWALRDELDSIAYLLGEDELTD